MCLTMCLGDICVCVSLKNASVGLATQALTFKMDKIMINNREFVTVDGSVVVRLIGSERDVEKLQNKILGLGFDIVAKSRDSDDDGITRCSSRWDYHHRVYYFSLKIC